MIFRDPYLNLYKFYFPKTIIVYAISQGSGKMQGSSILTALLLPLHSLGYKLDYLVFEEF